MSGQFQSSLQVRMYEIAAQGHLTGSAYLNYANQVLWEYLRSAEIDIDAMLASGIGPVNLETSIQFLSELRAGHTAKVTCELKFSTGKTYEAHQQFLKEDGTVAARLKGVYGLLDLRQRRLLVDPSAQWRRLAAHPERLGL